MLSSIAFSLSVLIVLAALIQLLVAIFFRRRVSCDEVVTMALESQHSVAVLLCVRGCDPSLRSAIIGILNQEFVSYQVHLVVDHRSDAAWDVVQEIKCEHDLNDILKIHEMKGAFGHMRIEMQCPSPRLGRNSRKRQIFGVDGCRCPTPSALAVGINGSVGI